MPNLKVWNQQTTQTTMMRISSASSTAATAIPAPRLVGIELNPGPSATAQTLFRDGLQSIFAFLSIQDLLLSHRVCHYWFDVCDASRPAPRLHRKLWFSPGEDQRARFVTVQSTWLCKHVTHVDWVQKYQKQTIVSSCLPLLPSFSSLIFLRLTLPFETDCSSFPLLTALEEFEVGDEYIEEYRFFMQDIIMMSNKSDLTQGSRLRGVNSFLTQARWMSRIPQLRLLRLTREFTVLWLKFIVAASSLLQLDSTVMIVFPHSCTISLPNRTDCSPILSALALVFPGMKLFLDTGRSISLPMTFTEVFAPLTLFTNLNQISLVSYQGRIYHPELLDLLCRCQTNNLTHLYLEGETTFATSEEWQRLFSHLTSLNRLDFDYTDEPDLLHLLTQSSLCIKQLLHLGLNGTQLTPNSFPLLSRFLSLQSFNLISAYRPAFTNLTCKTIIATLDDSSFIPTLRQITIDGSVDLQFDRDAREERTRYYRTKSRPVETAAASPPAARLIGIELNPGPMKAMNATTLFNDGLHSILAFLDDRSWLASALTCMHWFTVAASGASFPSLRSFEVVHESLLCPPVFPSSRSHSLRRHITTIDMRQTNAITVEDMNNIFAFCPLVNTFTAQIIRFQIAISSSEEWQPDHEFIKVVLPAQLTSLTLLLNRLSAAGTKSLVSQLCDTNPTLTKLTHLGLEDVRANAYLLNELHHLHQLSSLRSIDFGVEISKPYAHLAEEGIILPQIDTICLSTVEVSPLILQHLLSVLPNLRSFHVEQMAHLHLIVPISAQLTSLTVPDDYQLDHSDHRTKVLDTLCHCTHLTHLTIRNEFFSRSNDCLRLLSLPALTSLELDQDQPHLLRALRFLISQSSLIVLFNEKIRHLTLRSGSSRFHHSLANNLIIATLGYFTSLETLVLSFDGPFIDRIRCEKLKVELDDTTLMPNLQRLHIEHNTVINVTTHL